MSATRPQNIRTWYEALAAAWGPQHWWPAQSRFEVIVGAFLTQNTAWTNVEYAMRNLRRARVLSVDGIRRTALAELEQLVRPSGYFRQKAQRLKGFVGFLDDCYGGSLARMFAQPTEALREELLALHGVGRETADSILLYAGGHAAFVVDVYTRRVAHRHGVLPYDADYDAVRERFESELNTEEKQIPRFARDDNRKRNAMAAPVPHPPTRMSRARSSEVARRYNEMHGLLVNIGKLHCHKHAPRCEGCPLEPFLPHGRPRPLPPSPKPRRAAGQRG